MSGTACVASPFRGRCLRSPPHTVQTDRRHLFSKAPQVRKTSWSLTDVLRLLPDEFRRLTCVLHLLSAHAIVALDVHWTWLKSCLLRLFSGERTPAPPLRLFGEPLIDEPPGFPN